MKTEISNIRKEVIQIFKEYDNQIRESQLREKLLQKGYTPCHVEIELKELRELYEVQVYPIYATIDYNLVTHIPHVDLISDD